MTETMSDVELLGRGPAGVGELFDRHARAVFRLAYALLRDIHEADDVVQETFMVAWRKRGSITVVSDSALPWLLATGRLTALAARRRIARRGQSVDPADVAETIEAPPDDATAIREALECLDPHDRALVSAVLIDGLSYAEAGALLGITTAAAGKRLQRARIRLRLSLRPETALSKKGMS